MVLGSPSRFDAKGVSSDSAVHVYRVIDSWSDWLVNQNLHSSDPKPPVKFGKRSATFDR